MPRPDWQTYFMRIAYETATRATCNRKHVGAVIATQDNRIMSTGYNGSPAGTPSCDEVGHEISDGHCIRTLHAEDNALVFAGRDARGCTLYVTASPCYDCAKRAVNAGIKKVCYDEFYSSRYGKSSHVVDFLTQAGVECVQFDSARLETYKKMMKDLETLDAEMVKLTMPRET